MPAAAGTAAACSTSSPARSTIAAGTASASNAGRTAIGASCPVRPPAASGRSASRCRCSPRSPASTARAAIALAPRLMLLDEAFAGIDDAARAHCMGLIREFDLDFVITSEREWALLCRAARRRDLPAAAARRHRRRVRLALDLGRPGQDARGRSRPQVCAGMSDAADERLAAPARRRRISPRCASGCASASSARRSTAASSASASPGSTRKEHAALASLLGRPQRHSNSLQIDVRLVDAALRNAGIAASLRDALEQLDGPIVHLATARLQAADAVVGRDRRLQPSRPGRPARGRRQASALLKRLARQDAAAAAELCRRAEAVLRRLPAHGITRSQLAAEVLGDAHALDNGAGRGNARAGGLASARRGHRGRGRRRQRPNPRRAPIRSRRAARNGRATSGPGPGVLVNELARPALFLNLPVRGAGNHRWPSGEPAYASLRSLLRAPPAWDVAGRKVHRLRESQPAGDRRGSLGDRLRSDGLHGRHARLPRNGACCRSSPRRVRGSAIMAISTGPDCASATTSCASTLRSRGASEHKTMRPRWGRRGAWRSRSKANRSRRPGTERWRSPCRSTRYPLPRKPWLLRYCRISPIGSLLGPDHEPFGARGVVPPLQGQSTFGCIGDLAPDTARGTPPAGS